MARSKEKSKQLKLTATISVKEHARVVKELNVKNVVEIQKLQEAKSKALKEQRGIMLTILLLHLSSWGAVVIMLCYDVELKVVLKAKQGFISDLMLDVYRYTDAHDKLEKKLRDVDRQMVDSMQRIKDLSTELQHYSDATKVVLDLVDPAAGEAAEETATLLQQVQEAPQKLSAYVVGTVKLYVSTALGLVKAWHADTDLEPLGGGLPMDCSDGLRVPCS